MALAAAETAAGEGVSLEVVDLRSLSPIDFDTLSASVRKTKRAVIAHEAPVFMGLGAEIAARLTHDLFDTLVAPIERVGSADDALSALASRKALPAGCGPHPRSR